MKEDTNTIVENPEKVREAEIIAGIHAHPTLSEAVMEAPLRVFGKAIHICLKLFLKKFDNKLNLTY